MNSATMDTADLETRIQPDRLAEQGLPKPRRVAVVAAPDHTGDDAYFIYLVFPNRTPDKELSWNRIKPLVDWVRQTIWKADGERHFPYVRVKREREMKGEPA